jgi:hypothetical protein
MIELAIKKFVKINSPYCIIVEYNMLQDPRDWNIHRNIDCGILEPDTCSRGDECTYIGLGQEN